MKKISLLLIVASIVIGCCQKSNNTAAAQIDTCDIVLNNILCRKSVRHFTNEGVTEDQLAMLARAAMAAPTAVNTQPWEIIAITDRALLDSLAAVLPHAKMMAQAPAAIIICGNEERMLEGEGREYWVQDCSAATENLLLTAEAMGLGAVWTGAYPKMERANDIKSVLSLPDHIIPLCAIPIGHPTGEDMPKEKWEQTRYHFNQW